MLLESFVEIDLALNECLYWILWNGKLKVLYKQLNGQRNLTVKFIKRMQKAGGNMTEKNNHTEAQAVGLTTIPHCTTLLLPFFWDERDITDACPLVPKAGK